jgi:hypothetical protein
MKDRKFDLFSGTLYDDAHWLECVEGLANARERMEQIAAENPGQYFLFSILDQAVLAQIETFKKPEVSNGPINRKAF